MKKPSASGGGKRGAWIVKLSGSIRQVEWSGGRTVPSRKVPRVILPAGTAAPGPELRFGPGFSLPVGRQPSGCTKVPVPGPSLSALISYLVPSERRSLMGTARRDSDEQGHTL